MRIGVVFPQTEIGPDAGAVRAYAERVEALGFAHVLAYDHVIGADPTVHQPWNGPYTIDTQFHEPFVLFGYLAAVKALEVVTGILILPQRQTVLVAKQAAEVDVLTGGRFRLGIGLGWNAVEYEALGMRFDDRGRRVAEQVALLRRLWTERSVTHDGTYERVTAAGILPMPVQQPIPVWFGAAAPPALRRAGALGDGWFPMVSRANFAAAKALVDEGARAAGRDPDSIGMEGRANWADGGLDRVVAQVEFWRGAGATHVSVNTMNAGLGAVDAHLDALAEVAAALGLGTP